MNKISISVLAVTCGLLGILLSIPHDNHIAYADSVVATVAVGPGPHALIFNPSNNYTYVANSNSNTVSVISGTNVVDTVTVGQGPVALAFNPSNNYIYVANENSNTVSVISGTTVVGTVTVGSSPSVFAFNPSNNYTYVSNQNSNTVSVISGTTVVGTVTVSSVPFGLAFNPSNNYIYVATQGSNTVSVISGTTVVATVAVGSTPLTIAFNPSNNYIYVANLNSNTVSVISGTTVVGTVTVGSGPFGLAFNPSNNYIYVANENSNTVSVISGTNVVGNVTVGTRPLALAFNPSNNSTYVANSNSATVSVISGTNVVDTVTVGQGPVALAFNPSNNYIYVANINSNTVSVISSPILDNIRQIGNYALYGLQNVVLQNNVTMINGSVGVHNANPNFHLPANAEIYIHDNSNFLSPSSAIAADTIIISKGATVQNVFYNQLQNSGTILGTQKTPLQLPLVSSLPSFPRSTPGTTSVNVPAGGSSTLQPGAYGDISIGSTGVLELTGGIYNVTSIDAKESSKLLFDKPSQIVVQNFIKWDKGAQVGPSTSSLHAHDIIVFVGGNATINQNTTTTSLGKNAVINVNLFAPTGTIAMKDGTIATGAFIANSINIKQDSRIARDSAFGFQR